MSARSSRASHNATRLNLEREIENEKELLKAGEIEEIDAEYGQLFIHGIVPETDDPHAPSLTVRMVVLGTGWAVALALVNGIFSFRTASFAVSGNVVALLSYPMGIFLARVLPSGVLNPGPFTIKEHVLIYIIASSAGGRPYGIYNVVGQYFDAFIGDKNVNFWNSLGWVLTTQMLGYGISGMTRRFLVRPAAMYWPGNLSTVALFVSFHEEDESEEFRRVGGLSRYAFFWVTFSFMFVYQWIPSYFAGALTVFSFMCMVSRSKLARGLGGSSPFMGSGLLSLTFDYTNLYGTSMWISSPWYTSANYTFSYILLAWIVVPAMRYGNSFNRKIELVGDYQFDNGDNFYPLNSNKLYNSNTGRRFNPTKLYNPTDFSLNVTKYESYKPVYLSEAFAMSYFFSFMALTAGISHCAVWYSKDIIRQTKEMIKQMDEAKPDIHNTLMKAYPDIPEWMYLCWLAFWLVIQIIITVFTPFTMPVWGNFFGLFIAFLFTIPYGLIQGSTGTQLGLNIITELLMGLILPGQTVAVMSFKTFGYDVMIQALNLTADLKIGHYLHINPIHMVFSQLWGTLIGTVASTASVWIVQSSFPLGSRDWTFIDYYTFFNAGAIWGAIGPARFFGPDSPYFSLNLGYLFGIVLPILPWLASKAMPHPYWRFINFPIMCYSMQYVGGYANKFFTGGILAYIFMYLVFTYRHDWFSKYNYVMVAGIDAGSGLAVLLSSVIAIYFPAQPAIFNANVADFYCTGQGWDAFN